MMVPYLQSSSRKGAIATWLLFCILCGCAGEELIGSADVDTEIVDMGSNTETAPESDTDPDTDTDAGEDTESASSNCANLIVAGEYPVSATSIEVRGPTVAVSRFAGTCLDYGTPESIYTFTPLASVDYKLKICSSSPNTISLSLLDDSCNSEISCGLATGSCASIEESLVSGKQVYIVIEGNFGNDEVVLYIGSPSSTE